MSIRLVFPVNRQLRANEGWWPYDNWLTLVIAVSFPYTSWLCCFLYSYASFKPLSLVSVVIVMLLLLLLLHPAATVPVVNILFRNLEEFLPTSTQELG